MTQIAGTASDASGIASVTVNGEPVNGMFDWSANVTLTEGENTITVVATDDAGLTTTAAHSPPQTPQSQSAAVRATTLLTSVAMAVSHRSMR